MRNGSLFASFRFEAKKKYKRKSNTLVIGCAANILFEANRKQIFIHFEPNNIGFIRLFNIKANQQILHAKQIKRERFYLFRFKATNLKMKQIKNKEPNIIEV